MGATVGYNSLLIELFWPKLCSNGSRKGSLRSCPLPIIPLCLSREEGVIFFPLEPQKQSGYREGWIDTLWLKQIFSIFSVPTYTSTLSKSVPLQNYINCNKATKQRIVLKKFGSVSVLKFLQRLALVFPCNFSRGRDSLTDTCVESLKKWF